MIIISDYTLSFNEEADIFCSEYSGEFYCPECAALLKHRDFKPRIMRFEGGNKHNIQIERLKCAGCCRIHNALPDCLTPFKHYCTEVISGVLAGVITSDDLDGEDYPCERTMERWRHWMIANHLRIDGYLRSIGHRLLDFGEELLMSKVSLLDKLQESTGDWLETILRIIYNSGGFLVPI